MEDIRGCQRRCPQRVIHCQVARPLDYRTHVVAFCPSWRRCSSPSPATRAAVAEDFPVVAEVVRSGFVESRHHGAYVALDADGEIAAAAGPVGAPMFPRSSNKPLQAAAMLECGLRLEGELLALAAGSHSGEEFHLAGVRRILGAAGLDESALGCPPALPLDADAARSAVRAGQDPRPAFMNCSGKHAAMLATCVAAGWPAYWSAGSYRDPDHPLQVAIRATIERLAGEPVAAVGVDGCGAPLFALTLTGLARAYRSVVLADPDGTERRVADAMRAHPAWCSGSRRDERTLMRGVPGLLIKGGAEGVKAFALPDGRAGAVKIEDGAARASTPVTVAVLRALGATHLPGAPSARAALDELASVPVLGGGEPVGEVRAVSDTREAQ
ncbi:MAG: asparaginase [Streptosporangiales bacterium]|nr:asparaginase [Streptosporangiales bacterium]